MQNVIAVDFQGSTLYGTRVDGVVFIALKPVVDAMGLDWSAQFRRVQRNPILNEGVAMMAIPSSGGLQETIGLKLDLLHGWLFTIDSTGIKNRELRDRVQLFQRECYRVLSDHFGVRRGNRLKERISQIDRRGIGMVNEARLIYGRPAAAQLWDLLGLPKVPAMEEMRAQGDLFRKP